MDRDRNDRGPGLERPWTGKMVNLTPDCTTYGVHSTEMKIFLFYCYEKKVSFFIRGKRYTDRLLTFREEGRGDWW